MSALFDPARFVGFPRNRFEALDEVQQFFEFEGIDLSQVIRTLYRSSDGHLTFSFGDVDVHLSRSIYWRQDPNAIHLSIELDREAVHDEVSFEYSPKDLGAGLPK